MNKKNTLPLIILVVAVLTVTGIAGFLRWHALTTLNVDYDEDDYLRAAQEYAQLIRKGDWAGFMDTNYRPEHPPLAKIIYGLSILPAEEYPLIPDAATTAEPNRALPLPLLRNGRIISSTFGVITSGLLAIVNPLAGLMLAIHSFTIKYTSQVMLESLPALTSFLMVLCYTRWKKIEKQKKAFGWLIGSAIFLGLTAASKYIYCVIGLAVLADWLLDARETSTYKKSIRNILIWGAAAVVIFFLFDPYLWHDPINRLKESILFHAAYSKGASEVQSAGFPFWQPFYWITSTPRIWQPDSMYFAIDPLITLMAIFGLSRIWKTRRVYVLWLIFAMIFLLLWPTKWPQYILILTVPLSLAGAEGFTVLVINPLRNFYYKLRHRQKRIEVIAKNDLKAALPWLIPGLIFFLAFTILPLLFQLGVSSTDFNSVSIRDGLNGGITREVWKGLTGQVKANDFSFPFRSTSVHYVGLNSYLPLLSYLSQQEIFMFNIVWAVFSVALQAILGIGVALILWQRGLRFKQGWQTLFILPWAIPEMIGALMWLNVFQPVTGWLSLGVQQYGNAFPFSSLMGWENSWDGVLLILLISGIWYGFPFLMLAASAGLKMMPSEVFDAAEMDGANSWQIFRLITWPLLMPLIFPAIIVRSIFAFNQFYLFQTFGVWTGTLATLSYNFFNPSGFQINGQFSVSAVINIITMILLIGFVVLLNRWGKAEDGVAYA
jgi:ABC-type sugar transport system permease subunit